MQNSSLKGSENCLKLAALNCSKKAYQKLYIYPPPIIPHHSLQIKYSICPIFKTIGGKMANGILFKYFLSILAEHPPCMNVRLTDETFSHNFLFTPCLVWSGLIVRKYMWDRQCSLWEQTYQKTSNTLHTQRNK